MYRRFQTFISIMIILSVSVMLIGAAGYAAALNVELTINPDKTEVYTGTAPIILTAQASGSNLTYTWNLDGPGKLEGMGPAVMYIAPLEIEQGIVEAKVTVLVTDGAGQEATATITFNSDFRKKDNRQNLTLMFA